MRPCHTLRYLALAASLLPFAVAAAEKTPARESLDLTPVPSQPSSLAVPQPAPAIPVIPIARPVEPANIPPIVTIPLENIEKGVDEAAYLKLAKEQFVRLDRDKDGVLTRKDLPKPPAYTPSSIVPMKGSPAMPTGFKPLSAPPPIPPVKPAVAPGS